MTLRMRAWGAGAGIAIAALFLAGVLAPAGPARGQTETDCASTIDLMLVLDGSESISLSEFDTLQAFASDLVSHFTVSPDDAHIGVVQFAGESQGRVEIALTGDSTAIESAILNMQQIVGATDIQEGIALGQGQLTLNGRDGVPHVLILLTDGEHNQPGDPVAEGGLAKSLGTEIFAIAVGDGPKLAQLNAIVSQPADEHIFSVNDFDGLVAILEPLVLVMCPPTPTEQNPPGEPTPPAMETPPSDGEDLTDEVLGVSQLPAVGNGLPPELEHRGGDLLAQALGGVGGAFLSLAATYWVARRRVKD